MSNEFFAEDVCHSFDRALFSRAEPSKAVTRSTTTTQIKLFYPMPLPEFFAQRGETKRIFGSS